MACDSCPRPRSATLLVGRPHRHGLDAVIEAGAHDLEEEPLDDLLASRRSLEARALHCGRSAPGPLMAGTPAPLRVVCWARHARTPTRSRRRSRLDGDGEERMRDGGDEVLSASIALAILADCGSAAMVAVFTSTVSKFFSAASMSAASFSAARVAALSVAALFAAPLRCALLLAPALWTTPLFSPTLRLPLTGCGSPTFFGLRSSALVTVYGCSSACPRGAGRACPAWWPDRAGNGLIGELYGQLRCRRAIGAPER